MKEKDRVKIGKEISYILRHRPESANLSLNDDGYAHVDRLIKHLKISFEDLEEIVETNNKKRYAFNKDKTLIRASQGHSIDVDLKMKPKEPPRFLYHGTAKLYQEVIERQGLKKMNRQHVHLSLEEETAKSVGSRHGKPIIFIVYAEKMHTDGFKFFLSDNGVWLTDKVPQKYLVLK